MASTNKTTKLKLSKFAAADKPTFLQDYNGDMQKIDEAVATLNTAVTKTDAIVATLNTSVANINTVVASKAANADPNFTGTIKQANRPIGEVRTGFGNIATAGSGVYNITSGLRFNASLTAVYFGNKMWRIIGSGRGYGNTWGSTFEGISAAHIGTALGLGSTFFAVSQAGRSGKWIKYSKTTGAIDWYKMGEATAIYTNNTSKLLFARVDLPNTSGYNPWADNLAFEEGSVIDFEFYLKAALN